GPNPINNPGVCAVVDAIGACLVAGCHRFQGATLLPLLQHRGIRLSLAAATSTDRHVSIRAANTSGHFRSLGVALNLPGVFQMQAFQRVADTDGRLCAIAALGCRVFAVAVLAVAGGVAASVGL